jgi:hypothetical protein
MDACDAEVLEVIYHLRGVVKDDAHTVGKQDHEDILANNE